MRYVSWLRTPMLVLASCGLLLPAPAWAAEPAGAQSNGPMDKVFDVQLQKGGMLLGQVVDAQGTGKAGASVALLQGEKTIVTAKTNDGGYFAISQVPAGMYRLTTDGTQGVYRLWATGTAPPAAQEGALMVAGKGPARAQKGPLSYWLRNPWIVGGIVATAIAIPVIVHNNQSDDDTPVSN